MKLVEILARELKEWPRTEVLYLSQAQDGDLVLDFCDPVSDVPGDWEHLGKCFDRASDWIDAKVTRAQWETERARIAMDCISAFSQEQDQAEQAVSQYEQELWDKAAISAIGGIVASRGFHEYSTYQGVPENAAIFCAECADAFMAERAKRVGK